MAPFQGSLFSLKNIISEVNFMAVSEKTTLRHQKWKRQILDIIRTAPEASRIFVKRASGLSMDSTLSLIEELLSEGLIRSIGKAESGGAGRKATLLEINPQGAYFIGVRFSAAGISGVLMDFAYRPLAARRIELTANPQESELVEGIFSCVDSLIQHLGENRDRLRGIGLGAPGIIDLDKGLIVRYAHMPGISSLPLRQLVQDRFHVPTYLEHGVKCSARAALPQYPGCRDMLFLQTGRGIHLCVIIGGQIHSGTHYLSGEIGHMLCQNGQPLETLISSVSLCRSAHQAVIQNDPQFDILRSMTADRPSLDTLLLAANRGCIGCRHLLEQSGEAAALALASAIMIVNPQDILLSGTLCASPFFEQAIRQTLRLRCIPESLNGVRIRFIAADPREDATGAAMIPLHMQFSVSREAEEAVVD